jgi:phenylalanyl-tRNA synthetase beta chain
LAPAGVTLAPGVVDARGQLPDRGPVRVRTARVNRHLGTDLTDDDIAALLRPIGFTVDGAGAGLADVVVPSFRPDTRTETDIIEEVARHHGYSRIPRTVPPAVRTGRLSDRQAERRFVRQVLVGLGFDEALPLPFLAPSDVERAGLPDAVVTVTNPLDADESVLRPSLRPGLLKAVAYNASHRLPGVRLFEIGKVFGRPRPGEQLPDEREVVAAVVAGADAGAAVESWQVLAGSLGIERPELLQDPAAAVPGLHPTRSARILAGGQPIGTLGEVDEGVLRAFGIAERVAVVELDLDALAAVPHGPGVYRPISRFPSSDVDLAFEVDESVPAAAIEATVVEAGAPLLAGVRLFDVYRGGGEGSGPAVGRSLAYRLRFQAPDRTLTDADVAAARRRVIDAVTAAHPATLRG